DPIGFPVGASRATGAAGPGASRRRDAAGREGSAGAGRGRRRRPYGRRRGRGHRGRRRDRGGAERPGGRAAPPGLPGRPGGTVPAARPATVRRFLVTRERAATFRQAPGTAPSRLPAQTRVPRLFIAGAWTDTGWPATMEGAVRSGLAAARQALIKLGRTDRLPV